MSRYRTANVPEALLPDYEKYLLLMRTAGKEWNDAKRAFGLCSQGAYVTKVEGGARLCEKHRDYHREWKRSRK